MNIFSHLRKTNVAILLAASLSLAACGGGDGDAAPAQDSGGTSLGEVIICAFLFVLVDGACVSSSGGGSSSGVSQPGDIGSLPAFGGLDSSDLPTWTIGTVDELEPNNTLGNAQPLNLPTPYPQEAKVGIYVHGNISDTSDLVDTYIITVPVSQDYNFSICNRFLNCDGGNTADVFQMFFRLLDQDGNVLLSTQADEIGMNTATMYLDAGIVYYVTIHAGDTRTTSVPYRLGFVQTAIGCIDC